MCTVESPAQVVGLSLSSNSLNGVLPPSLGNLSSLVGLSLGRQGGHFFPDYVQSDSLMSLRLATGCVARVRALVWVEGLFSIRKRIRMAWCILHALFVPKVYGDSSQDAQPNRLSSSIPETLFQLEQLQVSQYKSACRVCAQLTHRCSSNPKTGARCPASVRAVGSTHAHAAICLLAGPAPGWE